MTVNFGVVADVCSKKGETGHPGQCPPVFRLTKVEKKVVEHEVTMAVMSKAKTFISTVKTFASKSMKIANEAYKTYQNSKDVYEKIRATPQHLQQQAGFCKKDWCDDDFWE